MTTPLALPTHTKIRNVSITTQNAVAIEESPFTFTQQAQANPGQRWLIDVTLPAMKRADAERWVAFLTRLRGRFGTFYLGDPLAASPRGTAASATITGSAGSNTVTVSMTGTLLAGDWFSLTVGTTKYLHKVLADRSGSGSMSIYPALRTSVSSSAADLTYPQGTFRLASNDTNYTISEVEHYGISFSAVEALAI
jgi:cytoskeletal protein RodZ